MTFDTRSNVTQPCRRLECAWDGDVYVIVGIRGRCVYPGGKEVCVQAQVWCVRSHMATGSVVAMLSEVLRKGNYVRVAA